jgi:hypothetical protein
MTFVNQLFESINCGQSSCFVFSNSPIPISITSSTFRNINTKVLFQLDFCSQFEITFSQISQIQIPQGSLFSTFQTDIVINQVSFSSIVQEPNGNSLAFSFLDSQFVSL